MVIQSFKILLDLLILSIKAGLQEGCVGSHTRLSSHTDLLFLDGPPSRSLCQAALQKRNPVASDSLPLEKKQLSAVMVMVLWASLCRPSTSTVRPTYRRNEKKRAQPRQATPFVAQTQTDPLSSLLCFCNRPPPSILRWAVTAREGSSRLGALFRLPTLYLVDLLHATGGGLSS